MAKKTWSEIKSERAAGTTTRKTGSSWSEIKKSRGVAASELPSSDSGIQKLDTKNAMTIKAGTNAPATNSGAITTDSKKVFQAKQDRFKVDDPMKNDDFDRYSKAGTDKRNQGFLGTGVEIKSGFSNFDMTEEYMTPDEEKRYNYFIGKGDKDSAKKYFKSIEPLLNARRNTFQSGEMRQNAKDNKVAGTLTNVVASFGTPIGIVDTAAKAMTGEKIDPNSRMYIGSQADQATREGLLDGTEGIGRFLGETGLSMAQYASKLPLGATAALGVLSSGAASNAAWDATNRGASANEALAVGTLAGVTEYLTEKIPMDMLFKLAKTNVNLISKEGVKNILKQAGVEGTEEVVAEYVNTISDIAIMGNRSQYEMYKAQLIASGVSPSQAEAEAKMQFFVKNPATAFAGGALSGGVFGAGATGIATYNINKTGKFMRGLGIEQDIIDTGMESGTETNSYQQASKVADIMKNGGKVSNFDVGSLYYANVDAINAENDDAQRRGISAVLVDSGVEEKEAEKISSVMQKAFSGDPLSNQEAEAIITNTVSRSLFSALTGIDVPLSTMSTMRKAVKQFSTDVVSGLAEPIMLNPRIEPQANENVASDTVAQTMAEPMPQAETTPQKVYSRDEIKAKIGKLGVAGSKSFGMNYNKDKDDLGSFSAAFNAYYNAGRTGLPVETVDKSYSGYAQAIDLNVRLSAYFAGQNDAATETSTRQKAKSSGKVVAFKNGKFTEGTKPVPKRVASILNAIASATGTNISMVQEVSAGGTKSAGNGYYLNGQIGIAEDADNPILVVAKHEITHRFKETAPEEYEIYKNYVINVMTEAGTLESDMKAIDRLYRSHGKNLKNDEIMDEIVANFTEQLFQNEAEFAKLVNANRTVAEKIMDLLRDLIAMISKAFQKNNVDVRNLQGFNLDDLRYAEGLWMEALNASGDMAESVTGTEIQEKFSLKNVVEETEDLIAVHNLTEDDLSKSIDLGGFPMPSIAIVPAKAGHSKFGPISVVFGKDTIDPKKNRNNQIYAGDAWTPTAPRIETEFDKAVMDRIHKDLTDAMQSVPSNAEIYNHKEWQQTVAYEIPTYRNNVMYVSFEDFLNEAYNEMGYKFAFLTQKGIAVEPIYWTDEGVTKLDTWDTPDSINQYFLPESKQKEYFPIRKNYSDEYKAWLRDLFAPAVKNTGLRNNKEYLTQSGNRRSFKQLHDPINLENIVKIMKGEDKVGSGALYANATLIGSSNPLKNIDEVKKNSKKLGKTIKYDYDQKVQGYEDNLNKLVDWMVRLESRGMSTDGARSAIFEIAQQRNRNKASAKKVLDFYGFKNADDVILKNIFQFLDEVKEIPTEYFEAKPRRAVTFDEVLAVVIPSNTAAALKDKIFGAGLNAIEYRAGDEQDRTIQINSIDGAKFSLKAKQATALDTEAAGVEYPTSINDYIFVGGFPKEVQDKIKAKTLRVYKKQYEDDQETIDQLMEDFEDQDLDLLIEGIGLNSENENRTMRQWERQIQSWLDEYLAANPNPTKAIRPMREGQVPYFSDSTVKEQVYHGTPAMFDVFSSDMTNTNTRGLWSQLGFFFTSKRQVAADYGDRIIEAYINLKNPIIIDPELRRSLGKEENVLKYVQENMDGHDGVILENIKDNPRRAKRRLASTVYIVFNSNQIKDVNNLNPTEDEGINFSLKSDEADLINEQIESNANSYYDEANDAVYHRYSLKSFKESDRRDTYNKLIQAGNTPSEAMRKMSQLYGVARLIMANKMLYDFEGDRDFSTIKDNSDYGFSFDASANCKKRLIYQATCDAIVKEIKNRPFVKNDYMMLRNILKDKDYMVGCGICFVDGQRMKLGEMAYDYLEKHPELKDKYSYYDFISTEGQVAMMKNDPKLFNDFITSKGSQNRPKPYEPRTDYRNELIKMFYGENKKARVDAFNEHGGFRMLSSSDFEFIHMLDFMQVITDAEIVGFKGQAYTKVPEFARFAGRTRLMINTSLIAKGTGLDADGNLIYDDIEGMPIKDAIDLRNEFPETVGNILVGANTKHILKAMESDFIDFIIPFHRSGLSKADYEYLGLKGYSDYQNIQSEKVRDENTGNWRNAKTAEEKSLLPKLSDWWDYTKTGEENAEAYLKLCDERGLKPAFVGEIGSKADGTYENVDFSRDENGNVRKGYWKLLIDFKMYDNNGKNLKQEVVKSEFDMDMIKQQFKDYKGEHNESHVKQDVVDEYVAEFKNAPPTAERMLELDAEMLSLKGVSDALKETEALREMNEYLKSQFKLTQDITVNKKKTEVYARSVLRDYMSNYSKTDLTDRVYSLYNYISGDQPDYEQALEDARNIAKDVLQESSVINNDLYKQYDDLIARVRKAPIKMGDIEKKEIELITNGSYGYFRQKHMGTLNLANDGESIDVFYESLTEEYPEFFDENITGVYEQLERITEVMQSLRPFRENPFDDDMDSAIEYLAYDIMDQFFNIPQAAPTFADKAEAKLTAEKIKAANQRRDLREKQKERIAVIKEMGKEKTRLLLEQERAKRVDKLAKLKDSYKARDEKRAKFMSDRQLRAKIARVAKDLNAKLMSPTDKQHIPENLRKPIAAFLASIDFTSDRQGQNTRDRLAALQATYLKIASGIDAGDSDFYMDIDSYVIDLMDDLIETIADKRLVDMTSDELQKLYEITKIIKFSVVNYNKLLYGDMQQNRAEMAQGVIMDLIPGKDKNESGYELMRSLDRLLNWHMLAPVDYFDQLGERMQMLYANIRKGLDVKVRNTKIITDYMNNLIDGVDIKQWTGNNAKTTTFELSKGTIELSPAQIMSLYLLNQREQAQGHIYGGGIKQAPTVTTKKGKKIIKKSFAPLQVTKADVEKILATMTEEQVKVAQGISQFLNTYTSEWGNEVSLKLYGYRKFMEKNYFPIKSDDNYLVSEFGRMLDPSLKGKGWTKATVKKASNPIIIEDIFDVFTRQADESSDYNAFVIPMSDIQKVVNYRDELGSVKQAIERRFGKDAIQYFAKLMLDINGGVRTEVGSEIPRLLLSNYKAASMGLNLRVIIQQPTALIRAAAMIDPKYLAKGVGTKGKWNEVIKYSPIALWKSWGYFSMDIGRQLKDLFLDETNKRDWMFAAIQKTDNMAWAKLWNAVEYEIQDTMPELVVGSDLYYQAVSRRFSDIVDRTQVVDTVLHRTQMMRSESIGMKMYTSFMAEPMKTYNMIRSALKKAILTGSDEDKKALARTIMAWLSAVLVNSLIVSLMDVFRNNDDEKKFSEEYVEKLIGNVANDIPGMFPYLKDIPNLIRGFDLKRMETEGLDAMVKASKRLADYAAAKFTGQQPKENLVYVSKDIASAAGSLLGIPVKNVYRDLSALAANIADVSQIGEMEYAATKVMYNINNSENRWRFVDILYKSVMAGDKDVAKRIYNDMVMNGIAPDYIKNGMNSRHRKTLDGTSEIETMSEAMAKWKETPENQRTPQMKAELQAEYEKNGKLLVEQGYTREEVEKAVKRTLAPVKTPTMKDLLKVYDKAESGDVEKQKEFSDMVNLMIENGFDTDDIKAAIEIHKESR